MYDLFQWTRASARRNRLTMEYEPLQPFFLLALAQRAGCATFLDVGANIGAYSLFATRLSDVKRIIAFEPDPRTLAELKSNIALNDFDERIEVQAKAVSSKQGNLTFGVVGKLSGANSVIDTSIHDRADFNSEVTVETITLDQLFAQPSAHPLCIKVDVEGHEGEVVEGARTMLKTNRAVIQIEGYEQDRSRQRLEKLGYIKLTHIGPDHYYSNLPTLNDPALVVEVYERASSDMIAFYHRNKPVRLELGEIAVQLTGKSAAAARNLKRRITKRH
jgi:FkbM family methyltransferase